MRHENVCYLVHPATLRPEKNLKLYLEFNLETNVDKKEKMHRCKSVLLLISKVDVNFTTKVTMTRDILTRY